MSIKDTMATMLKHQAKFICGYYFDDADQKIVSLQILPPKYEEILYSDITGYTPIEKGHSKNKKHGIARAVTGGVLFGGVGAIVGAATGGKDFDFIDRLSLTIHAMEGRSITLNFVTKETKVNKKTNALYEQFYDVKALLDGLLADRPAETKTASVDDMDQIRKLKGLLDDGIITQAEFDAKKKDILGI